LPDDVRLSDVEARFVCPAYGNWNRQPTAMMAISRILLQWQERMKRFGQKTN
jgi:hypothetical protein